MILSPESMHLQQSFPWVARVPVKQNATSSERCGHIRMLHLCCENSTGFPLGSVNFKIILFTFKAIHGIAPPYISELISIKAQSAYSLRSANGILLPPSIIITRKTLGDRAFQVAAPQLWNALPLELCQNTFRVLHDV